MKTPSPQKQALLQRTKPGHLYTRQANQAVQCFACGHRCHIPKGFDGICKVRTNVEGELRVPWGYVSALAIDPIEKKPFFHVRPGSNALSFGMLGCDLRCAYCQNWETSQVLRDPKAEGGPTSIGVRDIVELVDRYQIRTLASTYNEPLITAEWAVEIFKAARESGAQGAFVSNGNATPEVLDYLRPYVDLYKLDLKGFRDRAYRELGGVLKNVTDSIEQIAKRGFWLEIVTLLVPGYNDDPRELEEMAQFIAGISPEIPWHITAFHADYKMPNTAPTSLTSLREAGEIGKKAGLSYVYLGNTQGQLADWENTTCPRCEITLIERRGFEVRANHLKRGCCPKCEKKIAGVWN